MSLDPFKLTIKSFNIPELLIEIPENATIGSLKVKHCVVPTGHPYARPSEEVLRIRAYPEDLLTVVLKAVLDNTRINPGKIGDIVVGTVLVADLAAAIKAEGSLYDIGIGAGLESMSVNSMGWEGQVNPKVNEVQKAQDCLLPMGITSENVAHRYAESHRRTAAATASGKFTDEIVPVPTNIIDPKTGEEKKVVISVDDGIRPGTPASELAKLKPVFRKDGTTTAGNSSQVSDGAGAVLLMRRDVTGRTLNRIGRSFAAVGVDPAVMGVGPAAVAIPAAVKYAGLQIEHIDLFELNEAFASQFVYCCNKLGLGPIKSKSEWRSHRSRTSSWRNR
ncbi:hypothetical protein GUJ93_ZPchr0002g24643 [Zizania palustris]|uniref:Thiolase N-terminal domain-containing protein n=1 Tax=Zizania palustris TaxID=103762 RepID=A0A8J5RJC0_ZIZPA|nr:hypothetical protein GUJ93_ZPchr0002g24643 [Zizania palustris]